MVPDRWQTIGLKIGADADAVIFHRPPVELAGQGASIEIEIDSVSPSEQIF